jgi:hypothetical protein
MATRQVLALVATGVAAASLGAATTLPDAETPEGRDPTPTELLPAFEAAFPRESYAPGQRASLVIWNRARGVRLQIFRSGPEHIVTRSSSTMNGVPVTRIRPIADSPGRRVVPLAIGDWPSGLYFARLRAADGRVGFAPFIVRPRRLDEHRVAVVMPTLTWQAYNLRDEDGDGRGDSWYADWRHKTVRLGRPYLSRGVPHNFRRYDLPFLNWLARSGREVDMLAQSDLESATSARVLAARYDLIVFPGHHEYVTAREYDLVEGYRDLGGNLMFLSANNFFWQVRRQGKLLTKVRLWRNAGRPEASLVGVQYVASDYGGRQGAYIVNNGSSWAFTGTGLADGDRFGRYGFEIDARSPASPPGTQVLATIPNLMGSRSAEMTYYETPAGAKVFAAGALNFAASIGDPAVARLVENVWARLSGP